MCRRVDCGVCGKPTFAGCGAHVEQVLGDVPAAQRCPGHTKKPGGEGEGGKRGFLSGLFGK